MAERREKVGHGLTPGVREAEQPPFNNIDQNSQFYQNLLQDFSALPPNLPGTGHQAVDDLFFPWGCEPDPSLGLPFDNSWPLYNPDLDFNLNPDLLYNNPLPTLSQADSNSGSDSGLLGQQHFGEPIDNAANSGSDSGLLGQQHFGESLENPAFHDYNTVASGGRDLYAEALNQWNTPVTFETYDPFGSTTSPVFPVVDNVGRSATAPTYAPVPSKTKASKPSYSDIAKNRPVKGRSDSVSSSKGETVKTSGAPPSHIIGAPKVNPQVKNNPRTKVKVGRPHMTRSKSVPIEPANIRPDSRYGLDTFDDLTDPTGYKSTESNPSLSRKGSIDSGSGSSGIEEIHGKMCSKGPAYGAMGPQCTTKKNNGEKNEGHSSRTPVGGAELHSSRAPAGGAVHTEPTVRPSGAKHKKDVHKETKKSKGGDESLFFDPRRIFKKQQNSSNSSSSSNNKSYIPNNQQNINRREEEDSFLTTSKSHLKSSSARYINNDLRDSKKQTNTESRNSPSHCAKEEQESVGGGRVRPKKSDGAPLKDTLKKTKKSIQHKKGLLGEYLLQLWTMLVWLLTKGASLSGALAKLVLQVALLLCFVVWQYAMIYSSKAWNYVKHKIPYIKHRVADDEDGGLGKPKQRSVIGLKENIVLPTTGDEAMKRLLSCKGKDPYSILGVKHEASDDEIKKYYRKQAILVHPDKNQQPGAEEAFKILGHACEIIGEPSKRHHYDSQRTEAQEAESAMHEFSDLLSKLHTKIQEAANQMRCEHCGGKHNRIPTERPCYSARFCDRCNVLHLAKEGDVWAESKVFGFLWHYYAVMDGKVFDITEWANCQHESFKSMKANSHQVTYRISTGNTRHRQAPNRSNEADLEDFLSNLFHQSQGGENPENFAPGYGPSPNRAHWSQHTQTTQGGPKKGKRKKKKVPTATLR